MNVLVLLNSTSPGFREGSEVILPYLDHLGLPYTIIDVSRSPLPAEIENYSLIVIAHRLIDPHNTRLGKAGQKSVLDAVNKGCGLVSFDPAFFGSLDLRMTQNKTRGSKAETIEIRPIPHYITTRHPAGETLSLVQPMHVPVLDATPDAVLLNAGDRPLLIVAGIGSGRIVQWATLAWLKSSILGPLAGLDDILWRSLVWAARKPFALRGLPPLVTMRVDDVAGWGTHWQQTPLYWVRTANQYGFKPWLGLFIYNLTEPAIKELRSLIQNGSATAFPHAFGRPSRSADDGLYYYPEALPLRSSDYDEFIYFAHQKGRPYSDPEAFQGLEAVDRWYTAHAPLPISNYAIAHWYEMGSNVMTYLHDRWGTEFIAKVQDVDRPLADPTPWLTSGPFRLYERPGTCFFDPDRRGKRPVYYADFVNLANRQFFNCVTEIRDDVGYEWNPDNDVSGTVGRGVRQLRRALDSMALAVLFTHETDFLWKIQPDHWAEEIAKIASEISEYHPIYVTMDEGVRFVRATKTSRLTSFAWDESRRNIEATFSGYSDLPTHFYVFTETSGEIAARLVEIPAFQNKMVVTEYITR